MQAVHPETRPRTTNLGALHVKVSACVRRVRSGVTRLAAAAARDAPVKVSGRVPDSLALPARYTDTELLPS